MELVKIRDKENEKIVKKVKKTLASDFIGTGRFVLVEEKKENKKEVKEEMPKTTFGRE